MKSPEVGLDEFSIEPDGDGFEVTGMMPDGKSCFVGRFTSEDHAKLWIERRMLSSGRHSFSMGTYQSGRRSSLTNEDSDDKSD
jgi:hypothetical protein